MGFWKADSIGQSLEGAIRSGRNLRDAEDSLARTRSLIARAEEAETNNAKNLAEKLALRVALRKFDANHPLLTNLALQERIKDAGEKALKETGDYDAAKAAGENFKY